MKKFKPVVLLISFVTFISYAQVPAPAVLVTSPNLEKLCWYKNEKYSEGAIIKMTEFYFSCAQKNQFTMNGTVIWLKLDKHGQVIYPKPKRKITIK